MAQFSQLAQNGLAAYISTFWNRVDLALFISQGIALILRIMLMVRYHNDPEWQGNRTAVDVGADMLTELQFDFQLWGFIIFVFRFIEMVTFFRSMGEIWLMVVAMVYDSAGVIMYMLIMAFVNGLVMTGLPTSPI